MNLTLQFIGAGLAAYLIGSFPTGVVASKLLGAPDVRYHGSGHTGATNTMRLMGPYVGAVVVVVDGLKGLLAWAVALAIMPGNPWALPVAGVMAVSGHCWPIYTRFRGGMGLATGSGMLLVRSPLTIVLAVIVWSIIFMGVYKWEYSPRSVTLTLPISITLSLLFIAPAENVRWLLVFVAIVLIVRHLPQWNRVK